MTNSKLPKGFVLGAATSSYQIEGAWSEDGKGESIWDRFVHTPGTIEDGTTGDVACDHVHRMHEDVDLMADLGLDAYRFSISWPRVLPTGIGTVSEAGLAFYDRLVDALLEKGIEPFPTLYHWDLPQALQDVGGWAARTTVDAFSEYAEIVSRRLGDRVKHWITLNEPFVSATIGHLEGRHAPGHRSEREALAATHHLLLAHGRSVPILREHVQGGLIGITLVLGVAHAASDSEQDAIAAAMFDAALNRTYLDPLSARGYPAEVPYDRAVLDSFVRADDLEQIAAPIDFLGVNYYTRHVARSDTVPEEENAPRLVTVGKEKTDMGWEVYPEGLFEVFDRLSRDYDFPAYYVTENGAAYPDVVDADGLVRDGERISYLRRHLQQAARIVEARIPLRGYFAWSLMDNFEWSYGLKKRFGLIYVDFETGRRIPKASFAWYKETIARRAVR
jgi:beta-glucosidase